MAEANFPKLLTSFIVITLFIFLLLAVVISFAGNYGQDTTIINEKIGLSKVNSTLATTQAQAEGWQTTFSSFGEQSWWENILDVIGLLSVGMFKLASTMALFIFTPFAILSNILTNVLGIPLIVVGIVNVLIILTIVFGIWSLVKRGI